MHFLRRENGTKSANRNFWLWSIAMKMFFFKNIIIQCWTILNRSTLRDHSYENITFQKLCIPHNNNSLKCLLQKFLLQLYWPNIFHFSPLWVNLNYYSTTLIRWLCCVVVFKSDCPLLGPRPTGRVPSVGSF